MKIYAHYCLGLLLIFASEFEVEAQNKPGKQMSIRKAKGHIVLDGKVDEQDWLDADVAKDFFLNYPIDTAFAPFQTEARVTFDDHAFYASFVCYDDKKPDIVQSLRRDFDFDSNDNVALIMGPYNDGINGFFFLITPKGVQCEGTISSAGAGDDSYSATWDNKWYSKVVKYEDRWVAELRIPFSSFRYKSDAKEWNINFIRKDVKRNLQSSWIATPIQFFPGAFAYNGKLVWENPSPTHSTNISLIPFVAGGTTQDNEAVPVAKSDDLKVGMDAKIGITPSLNLDLTVNPDFSQVEVDRQVINLTRFEFRFPERRQFFLENSDLFDMAGYPDARPFFSRRIGLARDTTGALHKVPIIYGARVSGSLTKKWRMSLLNMQTKEQEKTLGLPGQNFSVASVQRNFGTQSNIQFSFVNKETLNVGRGDSLRYFNRSLWREKEINGATVNTLNRYNRVGTIDLELRNKQNSWYASSCFSHSFDDFNKSNNNTGLLFVQHTKRNYQIFAGESFVQRNYNAEAGYVPSQGVYPGFMNSFMGASGTFYPKSKKIVNYGPTLNLGVYTIPGNIISDKQGSLGFYTNFRNTANFNMTYNYTYQRLTNSFNPISDKYTKFFEGEHYDWNNVNVTYQSDQRKLLRYQLGTTVGGFYNGNNYNVNGEINYRYQPFGSLSVRFDYNDLQLSSGYGKEKLFIVSPRMDLTFTDKIFLTTFVQYNTLADNVNLNARFQWRYKPASDFFVVYTENYIPNGLGSKNRALVFKLTYWFNI
jgi:hypothetical protein